MQHHAAQSVRLRNEQAHEAGAGDDADDGEHAATTVHGLFMRAARAYPTSVALESSQQKLTYADVRRMAVSVCVCVCVCVCVEAGGKGEREGRR